MTSSQVARRARPRLAGRIHLGLIKAALLRLVLGTACGVVAWLWWSGTSSETVATPGPALISLSELTGMLAGVLVCAQILLVARVPWFEHAVGLDRLVGWHRVLGATVLLLTVTHVGLMVLGGALQDQQTLWDEFWTTTLPQQDVLIAVIGSILLILIGISSAQPVRRRLSYEVWYWLHVVAYLAVFLTFGHQIGAGAHFVEQPLSRLGWTVLYLATASAVVVWRLLLPLYQLIRHQVVVHAVVPETPTAASVWLRGRHLDELAVRPGQFLVLRFLRRGHLGTAHPYSVSALPYRGMMRITVGALGDHSSDVVNLTPGTRVLLEGPFGRPPVGGATGRALLVAGGVGIGPISTLAHHLAGQGQDVIVVHRGSSLLHLPLRHELEGRAGISYLPIPGRRRELGADPLRRSELARLVPDVRRREIFICGSPGLAASVSRSLGRLGVPSHRIHRDELSLS